MTTTHGNYRIDPSKTKLSRFKDPSVFYLLQGNCNIFYSADHLDVGFQDKLKQKCIYTCLFDYDGNTYVRSALFKRLNEKDAKFFDALEEKILKSASEYRAEMQQET